MNARSISNRTSPPRRACLRSGPAAWLPGLGLGLCLCLALGSGPALAQTAIPMPGSQPVQTSPAQTSPAQTIPAQTIPAQTSPAQTATARPAPQGSVAIPMPGQAPAGAASLEASQPAPASVDWAAGTLTATAETQPPAGFLDPDQSPALAVREALILARRQLFERVKALALDANRPVSEFFARNREAESKASSIIQNSQVLRSGANPGGGASAQVRARLWGPLAEALIPRNLAFQGGAYVVRSEDQNRTRVHTGLVVDARGTGAVPAILPRVVDERGAEAYGPGFATRVCAASQGLAGVFATPEEAARSGRVGPSPLTVKALRAQGRTRSELVLDLASANAVRALAGKDGPLAECRAAVILDGLEPSREASANATIPAPGAAGGRAAQGQTVPSPFGPVPPAAFSPASPAPGATPPAQSGPALPPQRPVPSN